MCAYFLVLTKSCAKLPCHYPPKYEHIRPAINSKMTYLNPAR